MPNSIAATPRWSAEIALILPANVSASFAGDGRPNRAGCCCVIGRGLAFPEGWCSASSVRPEYIRHSA